MIPGVTPLYAFTHRARPVSINDVGRKHWRVQVEHVNEWRKAGWALAVELKAKAAGPVGIEVTPFGPGARQDAGNCYPSAKAFIDGLVDAEVIPDDGPEYLRWVLMRDWQPEKSTTGLRFVVYNAEVLP